MTPVSEILFLNATVFTGSRVLTGASVRVAGGLIQEVSDGPLSGPNPVDLQGQWLVPGLIDLQLYGGSQLFMNEQPTAETVTHIYETHLQNGTTSLLPTLYSTSQATILKAIEAVRTVRQTNPLGVLGLHVEGPYLNPVKRGAHSLQYVRPPDERELQELIDKGQDEIAILTIAPECFTAEQIRWLQQSGLRLSMGHTNATYQQATEALDLGASSPAIPLATHLYNAMRPFESREPGVVGAIFDHPTVKASLVGDGFHCDPVSIRLAHRMLGDRLFLISDATFAYPPRPDFIFEDFDVHYENGRYVNQAGTIAGSAITLLDAVRVCVQQAGLAPEVAFKMASTIPAEIVDRGGQLGKIQPGYVANLIVLDEALKLQRVITA